MSNGLDIGCLLLSTVLGVKVLMIVYFDEAILSSNFCLVLPLRMEKNTTAANCCGSVKYGETA